MSAVGVLWIAACLVLPAALGWWIGARLRGRARTATRFAGAATSAWVVAFTHGVLTNGSSTAGLAFLFLPPFLVPAFAATWVVGWSIAVFAQRRAAAPVSAAGRVAAIAVLVATLAGSVAIAAFVVHERRVLAPDAAPAALRAAVAFRDDHPHAHDFAAALLMRSGDTLLLARVAEHPNAPEDVLAVLARDPQGSVASRAVANPALGAAALAALADALAPERRAWIASNPNAPPDRLVALVPDADPALALSLAIHPALPEALRGALFERAVAGGDVYVRNFAAVQPRMPAALLERLARDPEALVRRSAAANWKLPAAALDALAADSDADVRRMAEHMRAERATRAPDPAGASSR